MPALSLIAICSVLLYQSRSSKTIELSFPPQVATSTCMQLTKLCREQLPQRVRSAAELKLLLNATFPFIKNCSISYDRYQHAHITIDVEQPVVQISPTACITDHGTIAERTLYDEAIQNRLPTITIAQESIDPQTCTTIIAWIATIPQAIVEQYQITWHTATRIVLRPYNTPYPISYTVWIYTPITGALLEAMQKMLRLYEKKFTATGKNWKKGAIPWRINMRTPQYAIVTEGGQEPV